MKWSSVDWTATEAVVGRIQDRIFRAAKIKRPRLEPDDEQSSCPVLRGLGSGNGARLPDYVYGRRHHDGRLRLPGKPHSGRRFLRDPQRWTVLHRGALPAYIDWGTFEQNQEQMAANRTRYSGTPRGGTALLGGLVSCGVCGRRMFTTYTENGREARYVCHQMAVTFGAPRCQSISAQCVDALISAAMLEALSPSAIEVSLQVAEDLELERP